MIEALAALPFPNIDPVALQLGPIPIRWYALSYIVGILLGWWGITRALRQKTLPAPALPGVLLTPQLSISTRYGR